MTREDELEVMKQIDDALKKGLIEPCLPLWSPCDLYPEEGWVTQDVCGPQGLEQNHSEGQVPAAQD